MKTTLKIVNKLKAVAEEVGGKLRDYSGRWMYGRSCYGITCDSPNECIAAAGAHGIRGAQTDSMGLKSIVYWPNLEYDRDLQYEEEENAQEEG